MVKLAVDQLPWMSVAVYVTVVVPGANVSPGLCVEVIVEPQLSESVGSVHVTVATQASASVFWSMFAGVPEMAGASLSVTVTSNEDVVVFPLTSSEVYVTVVVPTGKKSPMEWEDVKSNTPQLSSVVGAVQLTLAPHCPASAVCVMSDGVPLMLGFSLSVTMMVKLAEVVLPAWSVAV